MIYICGECGSECKLIEKDCGSFLDKAYGRLKWCSYVIEVSKCCHSEDYEEVEEVCDEDNDDSPTIHSLSHIVDEIVDETDNLRKQME